MKITVVIPTFNEERTISKCLQSLMEQEVKPDEIIVVDNNSTDDTAKIAKAFFVRVVKETHQGMIPARNRGFNEAQGDIIARTDSDTILPKDWIKKIKYDFENNQVDGVTGPFYYGDFLFKTTFFAKMYLFFVSRIVHTPILFGPNLAITKKVWEKVKNEVCLDDKLVHEDIDLSIHIAKKGGKIFVDKSLIIATSGRSIKERPASFFIEYTKRLFTTLNTHK